MFHQSLAFIPSQNDTEWAWVKSLKPRPRGTGVPLWNMLGSYHSKDPNLTISPSPLAQPLRYVLPIFSDIPDFPSVGRSLNLRNSYRTSSWKRYLQSLVGGIASGLTDLRGIRICYPYALIIFQLDCISELVLFQWGGLTHETCYPREYRCLVHDRETCSGNLVKCPDVGAGFKPAPPRAFQSRYFLAEHPS